MSGPLNKHHAAREAWSKALTMVSFTIAELAREADLSASSVRGMVARWESEGYLTGDGAVHGQKFRIAGDAAKQTPAKRIWRVIRARKIFDVRDIAVMSSVPGDSVSDADVERFMAPLIDAGIIRRRGRADPAGLRPALFVLVRDTGPRPPEQRRYVCLYDPNTEQFFPSKTLKQRLGLS